MNINPNTLCQQYLNVLYQNIRRNSIEDVQNKDMAETYGEILYQSVNKLLSKIALSPQDVFFDLGSGLGKLTIQVFLNSPVKKSHGIEIIPGLYQKSLTAAQQVQRDLPEFFEGNRELSFSLGSFLDIPLNTASIVLVSSPCFSQNILRPLGAILDSIPTIHTVLTLRPISSLKRLSFKRAVRIEGSWDSALCYLYRN